MERLVFEELTLEHDKDFINLISDEELLQFMPWESGPTRIDAKKQIAAILRRPNNISYCIRLKESGAFVGFIGAILFGRNEAELKAEIEYVIAKEMQKKGYASEALAEFIRILFEDFKVYRVQGKYESSNLFSKKVMENCKMVYEGTMKGYMYFKGKRRDIGIMAILNEPGQRRIV